MSISSFLGQKCPDECPLCAGRDYVNPGVLQEAKQNGYDFHAKAPPCPRQLEQERDEARVELNRAEQTVTLLEAEVERLRAALEEKDEALESMRTQFLGGSVAVGWVKRLTDQVDAALLAGKEAEA